MFPEISWDSEKEKVCPQPNGLKQKRLLIVTAGMNDNSLCLEKIYTGTKYHFIYCEGHGVLTPSLCDLMIIILECKSDKNQITHRKSMNKIKRKMENMVLREENLNMLLSRPERKSTHIQAEGRLVKSSKAFSSDIKIYQRGGSRTYNCKKAIFFRIIWNTVKKGGKELLT